MRVVLPCDERREGCCVSSDWVPLTVTDTAFKQQRLKAWQPILTPRTVLPTIFIVGILFAPIGALLIWGSSLVRLFVPCRLCRSPLMRYAVSCIQVTEIDLDYTDCETLSAQNGSASTFTDLPTSKYAYKLRASDSKAPVSTPQYAFVDRTGAAGVAVGEEQQCVLQFDVPADIQPPVLLYYKLTNFYQNHRRYVKSLDQNQLRGDFVSADKLRGGDCKPLGAVGDKAVYPCGLIANSVFNGAWLACWVVPFGPLMVLLGPTDTFTNLSLTTDSSTNYTWSETGIAWPGESKKYATKPNYDISQITPPPNWARRFPDGYTDSNPPPDLKSDEHFQNWMRTAGLPTFTKLWGRNDNMKLAKGRYQITVNMSAYLSL